MLTLCTTPKPFHGHIGVIQRNALASWTRLEPRPEVLVFGEGEGVAEVCRELGLRHLPEVERTEHGTPYISGILRQAQERAAAELLAYVNSDILLLADFPAAVERVAAARDRFLAVSQRWELDVREPLAFGPGWQLELRRRVRAEAWLAGMTAIDLFVFRRGFYADIPPFVAGRGGFDWFLLHHALEAGAPVIDLTPAVTAVHQRHAGVWSKNGYHAELQHNFDLYRVPWTNLYDATHLLTRRGLRRIWWRRPLKPFWLLQERTGIPVVRAARFVRRRLAPARP